MKKECDKIKNIHRMTKKGYPRKNICFCGAIIVTKKAKDFFADIRMDLVSPGAITISYQ